MASVWLFFVMSVVVPASALLVASNAYGDELSNEPLVPRQYPLPPGRNYGSGGNRCQSTETFTLDVEKNKWVHWLSSDDPPPDAKVMTNYQQYPMIEFKGRPIYPANCADYCGQLGDRCVGYRAWTRTANGCDVYLSGGAAACDDKPQDRITLASEGGGYVNVCLAGTNPMGRGNYIGQGPWRDKETDFGDGPHDPCLEKVDTCCFGPPPVPPTPVPPTLGVANSSCEGATCTVSEDPHIEVFDGGQVSLSTMIDTEFSRDDDESGDKWLVKSSLVSIQARYMENDQLPDRNQFVRAVAIGGEFLKGNIIVIGSLEDKVTWNGGAILEHDNDSFDVEENGVEVNFTRGKQSRLVQDLSKTNFGIDVQLPLGIKLIVNRLHHHVNVAINMPPQEGGQEGLCGNFNGVSGDDSLEFGAKRFDPKVQSEESLFAGFAFK